MDIWRPSDIPWLLGPADLPCLLAGALVRIVDGVVPIEDLVAGHQVIENTGNVITIMESVRIPVRTRRARVVTVEAHAFGVDTPHTALRITPEHPFKIEADGPEDQARSYVAGNPLVTEGVQRTEAVYTFVTEERTSIDVNGLWVVTWSRDDWAARINARELSARRR